MNIIVYKLSDTSAQLVRRSLCKHAQHYKTSIYMKATSHLFTILRRIVIHINVASVNIVCGNILPGWNDTNWTCEAGVRHVYKGGVYHTTPSVFQRLGRWEGITVAETLRFYPYRATFDFECFFDGEDLPANSDRVQWIARHVPLSVSVASNVPGHELRAVMSQTATRTNWWAL